MKVVQEDQDFFSGECALAEVLRAEMEIDFGVLRGSWDKEQIRPKEIRLICDGRIVKTLPVLREKDKVEAAYLFDAAGAWLRADLYGDYYGVSDCRIRHDQPCLSETV